MVALHLRAAFERVRFEQLEDSLKDSESAASQSLLLPEPIEFDGIDRSNLEASLPKLRHLGFVLEEFGRNFYRMEGVLIGSILSMRFYICGISLKFLGKVEAVCTLIPLSGRPWKQSHYGKEGKYEISEVGNCSFSHSAFGLPEPLCLSRGMSRFILKFPREISRLALSGNSDSFAFYSLHEHHNEQ